MVSLHTNLLFTADEFNKFYPYYILFDKQLAVLSYGNGIKKIWPALEIGQHIANHFSSVKISLVESDFAALEKIKGESLWLEYNEYSHAQVTGKFEVIDEGRKLLFVGMPEMLKPNAVVAKTQRVDDSNTGRLYTLVANLQMGMLLEDENNRIVLVNKLFCDLFGIDEHPDELKGVDFSNYTEHTKALFKYPDIYINRLHKISTERVIVKNDLLRLADGRIYERDYVPFFIEGVFKGHLWQYRDVTVAKKNETDLQRLSAVAKANDNGVLFTQPNGKIMWVNQGFLKLSEYEEKDVIGRFPVELFAGPLTDKDTLKRIVYAFEAGISFEEEIIHYREDGSWFWGKTKGQAITDEDGNTVNYFAVIEDISPKRHAMDFLKFQEKKYRSIIANMNLGLIEVDLDENIQFSNSTFCKMSGYRPEELEGQNATQLLLKGDYVQKVKSKVELRTKGLSDAYEMAIYNKQGELRWWLVSGAPRYNDAGELVGTIGINLDITKQKQIEAELVRAMEEAEQSAKSKQLFLANMSHEIRTPMNGVLGMAKQLQKTHLTDRQSFFLNTITTSAENLLVILNDILDTSKIEAGKLTIEKIGFKLVDVVRKARLILLQKAEEKGLAIATQIDGAIDDVLIGDPYRLNQILLNFLSNAVKFSNKGVIKVSCVAKGLSNNIRTIEICVIDEGIGMSEDFLKQMFQNFSQEDVSNTRKYGGTGLGMAISKQLIGLMGGNVGVESQKDVGTIITIQIPFEIGTVNDLDVKPEVVEDLTILKDKRILLVEDNETNRLVATTSLLNFGADIFEVENGEQAIMALRNETFDLVLMDIQMPVMDGIEATKIIRNEMKLDIPIIALTANAIKGENERYLSIGMNGYISKPFEEVELISVITSNLGKEIIINTKPVEVIEDNNGALFSLRKLEDLGRESPTFLDRMLNLFIENTPAAVNDIKQAYENNDMDRVAAIAHRLKPSIDNLEINSIKSEIRELEKIAKTKDQPVRVEELIAHIESVTNRVVEELRLLV
jgi:two-component system, sensor histidine kinase